MEESHPAPLREEGGGAGAALDPNPSPELLLCSARLDGPMLGPAPASQGEGAGQRLSRQQEPVGRAGLQRHPAASLTC